MASRLTLNGDLAVVWCETKRGVSLVVNLMDKLPVETFSINLVFGGAATYWVLDARPGETVLLRRYTGRRVDDFQVPYEMQAISFRPSGMPEVVWKRALMAAHERVGCGSGCECAGLWSEFRDKGYVY